ncbi:MAG: DsrE family protein [Alphaproteobacteria bacterium]
MPPDPTLPDGVRPAKLSLIVYSGAFDKVHFALATAAAAIATNTPVTLFFTMDAIRCLTRAPDGTPGWQSAMSGGGETGGAVDAGLTARGVGGFEELLSACAELGARFMVCEMGLRAKEIARQNLRDDITFVDGGLVTFLNDARADGAMLFI